MVEIELDGQKVEVVEGSMVIHAAEKANVYIPHFCYHKKLSIAASCRMCLVDVEKATKPMPACATPVTQGMVVRTKTEKAIKAQQSVMEFLLINHPLDCPICDQGGECQLQDLAVGYGGSSSRYSEEKRVVQAKDILALLFSEEKFDINSIIKKPLVVSENLETLELLKEFKENKEYVHMALAVDEFGSVEGLITLNDLLEGIVGDIPGIDETDDPMATQRLDGTWLIDGRFQIDKFKELFDLYDCNLNDENIKQDVDKILAAHYDENNTTEVYKQCLSQIDLTSLNGTDTDGEIIAMVNKVNHFKANYPALPNVGAICVYPALVPVVKEHLSAGVGIAAVSAGFPASQTFIEVKVAETAMCVMEGATEIDVVISIGKFLEEKYQEE